MAKRRISRWLGPIALIVVVGAILAVINNSDVGGKSDSNSGSATLTGASGPPKAKKHRQHHHTYTVKAGDTLSAIAEKTGVSLAVIERLNPNIDAQTLNTGQKIKLTAS